MQQDGRVLAPEGGTTSGSVTPAIIAAAATGIVPFIERHGGDIDAIFGNSGIAPEMAGSTTLKLRLADFCRLFEQASTRTRLTNFGLWFGNQFAPRDLGLWGYAAVSAPTLGSALEHLVGLFRHHQDSSSMRFVHGADGLVRLEYQIVAPGIVERRQDAELSLGMFLNVVRECCGSGWTPEEVHFEHAEPEAWREHERAFGAPVYFSQATNALLFRPDILARPMPARDLTLMTLMRTCLEQLSQMSEQAQTLVDGTRNAVRARLPSGCPSLAAVAADLRVPQAALARALAAEGLTFKTLVEDTRRGLALGYLRQRHLPLSEVALLLGYSELSAFSRAVRRWTGTCPRKVREGLYRQ